MRLRLFKHPWICIVTIVVLVILGYTFHRISREQQLSRNYITRYHEDRRTRGRTTIAMKWPTEFIDGKAQHNLTTQVNVNIGAAKTTRDPELKIFQSMDLSKTDGLKMYLTCGTSVNSSHHADIRWSGKGLQQSLWVQQAHVTRQGDYIERKLYFKPWLDVHAGEYTCNLYVKENNHKFTVKKSTVISGKYRGLINSRNTTEKFSTGPPKPSKWFPDANYCKQDDLWHSYTNFHASVLSGKQKGKYLMYECTGYRCGGYGNRIHGITVLLMFAMLTKHVFLLQMTNPIDINAYFSPNAIQWNHTVPEELKTLRLNLHGEDNVNRYYKIFETVLLRNNSDYDIIRVEINFGWFYYLVTMGDIMLNRLISTFSLKTQYDVVLLYGCAFNYLFKYQPQVVQAIDSLQTELGLEAGKFVALHVRSYLYEGFVFNPLHTEFPYKLMFDCAVMAAKSLSVKLNIPRVPIFLATDHPTVIAYAKENYNDVIVLSRSPLFHFDRTKYSGMEAYSRYSSGMMGVLSDVEICSRAVVLVRSAVSTLSEVMGAIHFLRPQHNLHPYYFYENITLCQL